ncbi:MAG: transcription antitermination factor NusB [Gemmatimonadales bacterium]
MSVRTETRARALALQLLYAWDIPGAHNGGLPKGAWARVLALLSPRPWVTERALELAEAIVKRRAELDEHIERAAERWRIERIGIVDRNVLRLATFEIVTGDVPPKVAIDEAVRLAKWFGGEKSPGFVNGVLDRIARDAGRL